MSHPFRFALTGRGQQLIACAEVLLGRGHAIVGVLSDCPEVSAWSNSRGLFRESPGASGTAWLGSPAADYLLSIVNHAILPAELLAIPTKGAINYHDSLLPDYAGFNA